MMLDHERRAIADAKAEQRAHLDVPGPEDRRAAGAPDAARRLGGRLVEVGKLDSEEFDFANAPPVGGVEDATSSDSQKLVELGGEMQRLASMLSDRETSCARSKHVLMNRDLRGRGAAVRPAGYQGLDVVRFGKRTDPFNGKSPSPWRRFRRQARQRRGGGCVRRGRPVGKICRFGNLVEIRHADGYSTLYGHNKAELWSRSAMWSAGRPGAPTRQHRSLQRSACPLRGSSQRYTGQPGRFVKAD